VWGESCKYVEKRRNLEGMNSLGTWENTMQRKKGKGEPTISKEITNIKLQAEA